MRPINPRSTSIYARSRELRSLCHDLCSRLPSRARSLRDQIERASESVALNFVEGCGRSSPADRAHFFTVARGSAYEVSAAIDTALIRRLVSEPVACAGIDAADHVAAMLARWR